MQAVSAAAHACGGWRVYLFCFWAKPLGDETSSFALCRRFGGHRWRTWEAPATSTGNGIARCRRHSTKSDQKRACVRSCSCVRMLTTTDRLGMQPFRMVVGGSRILASNGAQFANSQRISEQYCVRGDGQIPLCQSGGPERHLLILPDARDALATQLIVPGVASPGQCQRALAVCWPCGPHEVVVWNPCVGLSEARARGRPARERSRCIPPRPPPRSRSLLSTTRCGMVAMAEFFCAQAGIEGIESQDAIRPSPVPVGSVLPNGWQPQGGSLHGCLRGYSREVRHPLPRGHLGQRWQAG